MARIFVDVVVVISSYSKGDETVIIEGVKARALTLITYNRE